MSCTYSNGVKPPYDTFTFSPFGIDASATMGVEAAGRARTVDTAGGATAGAVDAAARCRTGAVVVVAGAVVAGVVAWLLTATVVVGDAVLTGETVVAGAVVVVVAAAAAASRIDHTIAASFIMQHGSDWYPAPMHCVVVGHESEVKYVLPVPETEGSSVHVVPFRRITREVELPAATELFPTSRHSVDDTHVNAVTHTALGVFGMEVAITGNEMFVQRVWREPEPRSYSTAWLTL